MPEFTIKDISSKLNDIFTNLGLTAGVWIKFALAIITGGLLGFFAYKHFKESRIGLMIGFIVGFLIMIIFPAKLAVALAESLGGAIHIAIVIILILLYHKLCMISERLTVRLTFGLLFLFLIGWLCFFVEIEKAKGAIVFLVLLFITFLVLLGYNISSSFGKFAGEEVAPKYKMKKLEKLKKAEESLKHAEEIILAEFKICEAMIKNAEEENKAQLKTECKQLIGMGRRLQNLLKFLRKVRPEQLRELKRLVMQTVYEIKFVREIENKIENLPSTKSELINYFNRLMGLLQSIRIELEHLRRQILMEQKMEKD